MSKHTFDDHLLVFFFSWTDIAVTPVNLHALTTVKFEQLLAENLRGLSQKKEPVKL